MANKTVVMAENTGAVATHITPLTGLPYRNIQNFVRMIYFHLGG